MKRSILSFVLLLMTFVSLSGCIVVPWGHGHGHGHDDYYGDGHRGGGGGRGRH